MILEGRAHPSLNLPSHLHRSSPAGEANKMPVDTGGVVGRVWRAREERGVRGGGGKSSPGRGSPGRKIPTAPPAFFPQGTTSSPLRLSDPTKEPSNKEREV